MHTIRLPLNYINTANDQKGMNPDDVKVEADSFDTVDKFVKKSESTRVVRYSRLPRCTSISKCSGTLS